MLYEYVKQLLQLSEADFISISFLSDPYRNKLTPNQKNEFWAGAADFGVFMAKKIMNDYGSRTIKELLMLFSIKFTQFFEKPDPDYPLFAYFEAPNTIAINQQNLTASQDMIKTHKLTELLSDIDLEQIVLAHELYHFLENQYENPYPQKKLYTQRIFGISIIRRVPSLTEIAANAFVKEYFDLPFSPFVCNIIMLFPYCKSFAENQFLNYTKRKII